MHICNYQYTYTHAFSLKNITFLWKKMYENYQTMRHGTREGIGNTYNYR